jgi:hypothetical protein
MKNSPLVPAVNVPSPSGIEGSKVFFSEEKKQKTFTPPQLQLAADGSQSKAAEK